MLVDGLLSRWDVRYALKWNKYKRRIFAINLLRQSAFMRWLQSQFARNAHKTRKNKKQEKTRRNKKKSFHFRLTHLGDGISAGGSLCTVLRNLIFFCASTYVLGQNIHHKQLNNQKTKNVNYVLLLLNPNTEEVKNKNDEKTTKTTYLAPS